MGIWIVKGVIAVAIVVALALWRDHTELEFRSNGAAELITDILVCYGVFSLFDMISPAIAGS